MRQSCSRKLSVVFLAHQFEHKVNSDLPNLNIQRIPDCGKAKLKIKDRRFERKSSSEYQQFAPKITAVTK